MLSVLEEKEILNHVKNGNNTAFAEIVAQYQLPIQRYLFRLTKDYEMAQDLAQDTFLQAYKSLSKNKSNIHEFRPWLYRIATNQAFNYRRRKKFLTLLLFKQSNKVEQPFGNIPTGQVFKNMEINEAFLNVPENQKVCLVLHFVEGFNYKEIGEIIGISEDAVRKRISRGTREFRRVYNHTGGG